MKLGLKGLLLAAGLAVSSLSPAMASNRAAPPESAISYQGVLSDAGTPFEGQRDFRFSLFDAETGGTAIQSVEIFSVEIVAGLFTAEVDFGAAAWVDNQQYWIEIEVGPADGSQTYENLGRQKLSATPYAMNTRGLTVDAVGNVGIGSGLPERQLHLTDGLPIAPGSISANTDLLVTSADSGITLVSSDGGSVGSFLDFMEQTIAGGLIDNWSIIRGTPTNASRLDFAYGTTFSGSTNAKIMSLLPSGNVGIGTVTPEWTLDLRTTSNPTINLRNPSSPQGVRMTSGTEAGLRFTTTDGSPINIMELEYSGNVGIGTTTPQSRLDVRFSDGNGIEVTDSTTATSGIGVHATVGPGTGVRGVSTATSGSNSFGVYGQTSSLSGWGVYSNGRLGASGNKSFMIDHPLDPMGAYLLHYSSESPEPQNRYNGNAIMNAAGRAVVRLPDYFQSINKDFRYTLTPIGSPGPNLYIAQEVENNAFVIAGGTPGQKVTWEVIAQRNDQFVRQRGAPIEVQKVGPERGRLLMPELFGLSPEDGIHYIEPARMERADVLGVGPGGN